jgi:hypothetical protein
MAGLPGVACCSKNHVPNSLSPGPCCPGSWEPASPPELPETVKVGTDRQKKMVISFLQIWMVSKNMQNNLVSNDFLWTQNSTRSLEPGTSFPRLRLGFQRPLSLQNLQQNHVRLPFFPLNLMKFGGFLVGFSFKIFKENKWFRMKSDFLAHASFYISI